MRLVPPLMEWIGPVLAQAYSRAGPANKATQVERLHSDRNKEHVCFVIAIIGNMNSSFLVFFAPVSETDGMERP